MSNKSDMQHRWCECCGAFVGTMTNETWVFLDEMCDVCRPIMDKVEDTCGQ